MEILFRGKSKTTKKWVYGGAYNIGDDLYIVPTRYVKSGICPSMGKNIALPHLVTSTVGQYIGRNDHKKEKLFDGDIMRHRWVKNHYGVIKYFPEAAAFLISIEDYAFPRKINDDWEKCGNTHDNPELLEKPCQD